MLMHIRTPIVVLAIVCVAFTGAATAAATDYPASLPPSLCKQLGGVLDCKPALAGAWAYRVKDLFNDIRYPTEAAAYAYLMRVRNAKSVFALAYRWATADSAGFPTTHDHSIETASWKVFERCAPGDDEFVCDRHPEYMAYQRIRQVSCPENYQFSSDRASSYCLPRMPAELPVVVSR